MEGLKNKAAAALHVMAHARRDDNLSILYLEHEPVEVVDANAPPSCAVVLEGLGLADARVAVAVYAFDELAYLSICLFVSP